MSLIRVWFMRRSIRWRYNISPYIYIMITYYVIAHPNYSLIEPLTEPGLVRSNERLTEQMIAFVYLFIYDELLVYGLVRRLRRWTPLGFDCWRRNFERTSSASCGTSGN